MANNRQRKNELSVSGSSLNLGDLRWLVEQAGDAADSSRVNITHYSADRPGDISTNTITVNISQNVSTSESVW